MANSTNSTIKLSSEHQFSHELAALKAADQFPKPYLWELSPQAVLVYILGGSLAGNVQISPKYLGNKNLVEVAIASLLSDRALLLTGIPGTAKTWLSEHLAAAISGTSKMLIQGTAGSTEEQLRYGWNYAELIANGPSQKALVPSPVMKAMELGSIVRVEELSRMPSEVQDALITILSEKTIAIPELNSEVLATEGFNLIATSNDKDKGVYEMSAALRRRFNIVVLPLPKNLEEELNIVVYRVKQLAKPIGLSFEELKKQQLEKLIHIFRELRSGVSADGKQKIKMVNSNLSPAEAISIVHQARIEAFYFENNKLQTKALAQGLINSVGINKNDEIVTLQDYNETVLKKRSEFKDWYTAFKEILY